jgi:hypothetical protein
MEHVNVIHVDPDMKLFLLQLDQLLVILVMLEIMQMELEDHVNHVQMELIHQM